MRAASATRRTGGPAPAHLSVRTARVKIAAAGGLAGHGIMRAMSGCQDAAVPRRPRPSWRAAALAAALAGGGRPAHRGGVGPRGVDPGRARRGRARGRPVPRVPCVCLRSLDRRRACADADAGWFVDDAMAAADDATLREILAQPRSGAPWQFHRACLVPESSPSALSPLLAEVDAVRDAADVPRVVGVLARHGVATLFDAELQADWSVAGHAVFGLAPRDATITAAPDDEIVRAVEASLIAAGSAPAGARALVRFERARARAVAHGSDAELRPPA